MRKHEGVLVLMLTIGCAAFAQNSAVRIVDLKAADGTALKATYFAAEKPGPGVLLLHQINRDRKSWDELAAQLAAAGIHTLTLDLRGFGESGTRLEKLTEAERSKYRRGWPEDVDAALDYLSSRPRVDRNLIGAGGAGWLGVLHSVDAARRHPEQIKSLVLMSGETPRDGLQFLHQASQLPELFVFSDDDEYPPTQDAMKLLYVTASSPSKKLVHYSAAQDAPWLWYETFEGKPPAHGGHGTDMFQSHPELPGIIVDRFVTTLVKNPSHAPADALAAASILNQLQVPGGAAQVTQQLLDARSKDPQAQLWPEAAVDIIGEDYQRAGDVKNAIEVFRLNLLAYPDSADAHSNLADAYLADGQKDPARQYAEKTLALLDSHKAPASSWSDTEQRRGEIRRDAERTLAQATKQPSNETHSIENRFPRREAGCTLRTKRGDIPERALSPTHYLRHGADRQERSDSQCPGYRGVPIRDEAGHYRRPRPSLDLGTSA
jgi:dienelactone hydrolase